MITMQRLKRSIKCHQYDLISILTEINFNKCEFREKLCEFISLIINFVQDSRLKLTKLCWI